MRNLIYFIREGVQGLRSHALVSFAAIGTIAACLLVTGCFGLVAANLQLNVEQLMGDREFLAYLEDGLTEAEYEQAGEALSALDGVAEVTYISNKEALEDRLSESSLTSVYFENVDYNLLQNRYHVVVTDAEQLEGCVAAAQALPGVEHVYASYTLARQITALRNNCLTGAAIMIALLLLVSAFIISNAVRLAVVAREEEIAIMRLVGATKGFIRAPFLVEGILIGLIGGLCAFGLTSGLYCLAQNAMVKLGAGGVISLYPYRQLWMLLACMQVGIGLLTGVLGTAVSIRRALRT